MLECDVSKKVNKQCRTAKDNPPVTFAIAACETQNVNVTVLPSFGISGETGITASDMWTTMVQVAVLCYLQYFFCETQDFHYGLPCDLWFIFCFVSNHV